MDLHHICILTHKYPSRKKGRVDARIHIYDFAHALAKHVSVFVLAPDPGGEKETDSRVPVTWFSSRNTVELFTKGRQAAVEFVQSNKIDFCIAAWAIPSGYLAYYIKKTLGIPYAVWALGSDIHTYAQYPILRQLIATWLKEADLRFANSYRLCDDVMRLSGKECTFMPVISDFPTQPVLRVIKRRKSFQFLYVGRLERVKGIDLLIEACSLIAKQKCLFQLAIIGEGSLRQEIEKKIRYFGLQHMITLTGSQDREVVVRCMRNADCLIIPSRKESFPQVFLESARIGLPAIVTDVGDCGRILLKYRCGVFVENNTPASLADAMSQCMKDRHRLQRHYGKGLQAFVKEFTAVRPETIFLQKLKKSIFTEGKKSITVRV